MKVRDIMTTEVVVAHPDTSVNLVARLMAGRDISGIPVVEDGRVIGIVTEHAGVEGPPLFIERQRFLARTLSTALLLGVAAVTLWAVTSPGTLRPREWVPLIVGVGLVLLFHFLELTVTVRPFEIDIRFRPLTRRRIPHRTVRSCEARTYRALREYGGWGVRRGWKGGWAYNVRGNRGVQLVLEGGESILIGSQRADELAAAIRSVASLSPVDNRG